MAQKVHIVLTDDLDETVAADETITFGLDGATYEIDLSAANAAALREALAPYVGKGRPVGGRAKPAAATRRRRGSASDATEVRAWAKSKGMKVNDRGRVPADVRAAYEAAHS